jgi:hypothetical protein
MLVAPAAANAQSQTTSALRGEVHSAQGVPIANVEVRVRHVPTGSERTVVTDVTGRFLVLLLQPGGPYAVTASRIGYAEGREADIQLRVGETHVVRIVLEERAVEVEGVRLTVERAAIFNPSQIGPVTRLSRRDLASVPILSRDVMDLAALSPLVRTTEAGGLSVGGQNDRYNAILVDGLQNQDAFGLTAQGIPGGQAGTKLLPLDAVAQYEVLVAPYDVRLSGFAGGVMNAVTETGTNDWTLRTVAAGRDASLMGDLSLPSGPAEASGVQRALVGVSAGGPLVRDRAHVFLSTELERRRRPPSGYSLERDPSPLVGISEDIMEDFQRRFEEDHGVDTGEAGPYTLEQSLASGFARVDWQLGGGSRLAARNVFAYATNDEPPNRSPFEPYGLSSNAVMRTSISNITSVQLFTDLADRGGNELDLTVQRTADRTEPARDWPQVEVVLRSPEEAFTATRPVRAGAQYYAQQNDLTQTSVRLSNTLTLPRGRNTWILGAAGSWYGIRHSYLPGSRGDWTFASWTDVLNNAPERLQRTVLLEGEESEVSFNVVEMGAFVQHEVEVGNLNLRLGLRADVPLVLDQPEENDRVLGFFGRSTAYMPRGRVLVSPRIGFNWQRGRERRTQLRGGAGLFTGQPPYVWLSNAFHNNGLRSVLRVCTGRWTDDPATGNTAPPFDPTNSDPTCLLGPPRESRAVVLFDDGFAYPQYAKISATVDQELTSRISASLDVILSHAVRQVLLRELNIHPQDRALGPLRGYGGTARMHFGTPTDDGFSPIRLLPGYDQVLLVTNGSGDRSYSVGLQVRGALTDRVTVRAGYSYARSYDRQGLASVDLVSNFGLTPTHGDPNDPPLTPSNFDRPHKLVLALYGTPVPGLENTEVSLLYTAESGLPFAYVYRGDYNGDGYPSEGAAFDRNNDLVYVPRDPFEVPSSFGTSARLQGALATDRCLQRFQGQIMLRNHCRAPWQNRLHLRLAHTVQIGGASARVEADLVNVLNLLNSRWGLVKTIGPTASLLEPLERVPVTAELMSEWAGGVLPFRDASGAFVTPEPWLVAAPQSQWQAQLGVRIAFGRTGAS